MIGDVEILFAAAISVWNRALEAHRQNETYCRLLEKGERALGGRPVAVEVYDDRSSAPVARFGITLRDGLLEPHAESDECLLPAWQIRRADLEELSAAPERFVQDPSCLDWSWLVDRIAE